MNIWSPQLQSLKNRFEDTLRAHLPRPSSTHYGDWAKACSQAHRHPVEAGGKRVRPLITLLLAATLGGEETLEQAFPAALALEFIHTYSLVHDDLPAMDNGALRRGQPTTHTLYGEGQAILVGDGLLTHAFWVLSRGRQPYGPCPLWSVLEATEILAEAAGPLGMVLGQWVDIANAPPRQPGALEERHALKTGALFGASCAMGVLGALGAQHPSHPPQGYRTWVQDAYAIGRELGVVFQLADDVLDLGGDTHHTGKNAGADSANNRESAITVFGDLDHVEGRALTQLNGLKTRVDAFVGEVTRSWETHPHHQWSLAFQECLDALFHRKA